jgi:menaquinol-cytochrome c reductase iron-sulfur subunit
MKEQDFPAQPERRRFLTKATALTIGTVVTLVPAGAGLVMLLDPLRHKAKAGSFLRVATLNSLPDDGAPRQFPIVADRQDAWNKFPQVRVGAIYLRKTGPREVQAINVVCPHAGCFVNYQPDQAQYLCPCHNSSFALDGGIKDPSSPSPRPLDTLEVKVGEDGAVWVKFENYRAGIHEKIVV